MHCPRFTTLPVLLLAITACTDDAPPTGPGALPPSLASSSLGDFHRYVAIGTSITAGVQNDGKTAATQRTSWPAQLARLAGRELSQPYLAGTGCRPPLQAPLITFRRVTGESPGTPGAQLSCSQLQEGITVPTANLGISGARASYALFNTPENIAGVDPDNAKVYPRTLAPGQTQVAAMMAQNPKIVSVELFGNEVLLARTGIAIVGATLAPLQQFTEPYDLILDSIQRVGAKAVLVGVSGSIADFPAFRRGNDLWKEAQSFALYNVQVSADCENSQNLLFIPFKITPAVGAGLQSAQQGGPPAVLSCAASPSPTTADFVLDPNEVAIVDNVLGAIGAHIQAQAEARGFARVDLGVMYNRPENRPALNAQAFMQGPAPYGPNISIDGVHPTAEGSRILADAAAAALNARYGFDIRRAPTPETNVTPVVTELLAYGRGATGPITGLNGDLVRFRLGDRGDPGPWRLRVDWGDGVVHTPTVTRKGDISLLRSEAFPGPGSYTVVVTATDLTGATSAPRTTTITVQ